MDGAPERPTYQGGETMILNLLYSELAHQYSGRKEHVSPKQMSSFLRVLGPTTNIILYNVFRQNLGKEFTRSELRREVVDQKRQYQQNGKDEAASRIQAGKLAVDYWIDHFVQEKVITKRNSNPVVFWMDEDTLQIIASEEKEKSKRALERLVAA